MGLVIEALEQLQRCRSLVTRCRPSQRGDIRPGTAPGKGFGAIGLVRVSLDQFVSSL